MRYLLDSLMRAEERLWKFAGPEPVVQGEPGGAAGTRSDPPPPACP